MRARGNLSAELFPGVSELIVSQSKINMNENYNCTCICKELLGIAKSECRCEMPVLTNLICYFMQFCTIVTQN